MTFSWLGHRNAECRYYILFIIFGITPFTGLCRVWVLQLSLVTVLIRSILDFTLMKIITKAENVLTILALPFFNKEQTIYHNDLSIYLK